jgi:hypothetical protein
MSIFSSTPLPTEPLVTHPSMVTTTSTSLIPIPLGLAISHLKSNVIFPFHVHAPGHIQVEGVVHAYDTVGSLHPQQLCINPIMIWVHVAMEYQNLGYQVFQFLTYSSSNHFFINHPDTQVMGSLTADDFPAKCPQVLQTLLLIRLLGYQSQILQIHPHRILKNKSSL